MPVNIPVDVSTDFTIVESFTYDFNTPRPDTDIVLISGDKPPSEAKSFYAHRSILALASPFFRDMFTLPQPAPQSSDVDANGIPCIHVTESHAVISLLLQLLYPFPKPVLNPDTLPIPLFSELLRAVTKYDLYFPLSYLRSILVSPDAGYLNEDPTRVYAVACRYNLEKEAQEAMKWVVRRGIDMRSVPLQEEWKLVSAWEYRRLDNWVREKRKQVGELVANYYKTSNAYRDMLWENALVIDVSEMALMPKCMQCNGSPYNKNDEPKWWTEFAKRVSEKQGVGMGGTDGIFAMDFLAGVVKDCGCPRCGGSVITSAHFLQELENDVYKLINEEKTAGPDGS